MALRRCLAFALIAGCLLSKPATLRADDYEREPINYTKAPASNPVQRLQDRLAAGQVKLAHDVRFGYLPSMLTALDVPASSQTLVFSKTSMQRHRIGPKTPRALYFNDDLYIGYCQRGNVLEISAVDPGLGTVYYTLDQHADAKPKFLRQNDACLTCHGSSQTRGIPGHLLRSLATDAQGTPILSLGTTRVEQTTPLAQRWGGWYVTGTHGGQTHLGNLIGQGRPEPAEVARLGGLNVTRLQERFDTSAYLTPHSDLVALMVLEHQVEAHNLFARASLQTRLALHDEATLNKELGRVGSDYSETTYRRIKSVADPLVKYLLFSGEAKLTETLHGTSPFAEEFARRGPRDARGRSLREFDLQTRLFKYPCSYLVQTPTFEALPGPLKDEVLRHLHTVLIGRDYSRDFDHLSATDRQAILDILRGTLRDLPAYWREGNAGG